MGGMAMGGGIAAGGGMATGDGISVGDGIATGGGMAIGDRISVGGGMVVGIEIDGCARDCIGDKGVAVCICGILFFLLFLTFGRDDTSVNTSHSADAQTYVVAFRGSVGAKNFATAFRLRLEALRVTRWVAESPHGVFFSHSPISPISHTPFSLYISNEFFLGRHPVGARAALARGGVDVPPGAPPLGAQVEDVQLFILPAQHDRGVV